MQNKQCKKNKIKDRRKEKKPKPWVASQEALVFGPELDRNASKSLLVRTRTDSRLYEEVICLLPEVARTSLLAGRKRVLLARRCLAAGYQRLPAVL